MDEALLLASRLAIGAIGTGGTVLIAAAAARSAVAYVPASAGAVILLDNTVSAWLSNDLPTWQVALVTAPWFICFPLFAATFPDGRFRPRWSIALIVVAAAGIVADAATGFGIREAPWWGAAASLALAAAGACMVIRYRRSATTLERERLRWILLGLLLTVAGFALIQLLDGEIGGPGPLGVAKANLAGTPLVLGLVIAAAAPRLWNVDVVLRGALLVLSASWMLVGVYAATGWVAVALGASPIVAARWGALTCAILAYPVVRGAMRTASWLVFRDRLSPAGAVARLGLILNRDAPGSVSDRVIQVAKEATGSEHVALTDSPVDAGPAAAEQGPAPGPSREPGRGTEEFPIVFRGERIGTLIVAPRPGESELTVRDRAVVEALARHAAPALDGARAFLVATHAQTALVSAREEERRMLRRELHDDLGPALSGLALSAAAIAHRAARIDTDLAEAAHELQDDIQGSLARAREISHGLRPAVLDDRGLVAAIRERVGSLTGFELRAGELGELPAAVDLAALRIVQEAVTNVRRHASATYCVVVIERDGSDLRIGITDDGVGMPRAPRAGLGVRSIRERAAELGGEAHYDHLSGGGTRLSVRLPLPTSRGAAV